MLGKYTGRNGHAMKCALRTVVAQRRAGDPALLTAFQRWQDPVWRRDTLSIR